MTTSDNIAAIESLCGRLQERKKLKFMASTANGPAQLVTIDDLFEAVEALSAYPALLAEARKAEAMKQEIAELRAALKPFADVADLVDSETEGVADSDEFQMHFHDYLMASWKLSIFRRARTLLNGGSDAQG